MKKKVDFLIIGSQKAGTTSLFHYLTQHPEIYFSEVKEVNYFVMDHFFAKGEKYYHSFFNRYKNQKVIGSSYVHMLPCEKCISRVYHYNPDMKFIIMLRDPVERAISGYEYALRNGWESQGNTIADALSLEGSRLQQEAYDLTYFYNGLYNRHITNWMERFPRGQFLILKQEHLKHDPEEIFNSIFEFLQISKRSIDTTVRYNVASGVHNKSLQKIMLAKGSPINRLLGALMSQQAKVFIRSKIFPLIYKANTSRRKENKTMLTALEQEELRNYFEKDLEALEKNFNITYAHKKSIGDSLVP